MRAIIFVKILIHNIIIIIKLIKLILLVMKKFYQ